MKEINALILNIHTIIKKGVNMPLGFIGEVLFFSRMGNGYIWIMY